MSARQRVLAIVALTGSVVVGATVGITYLQARGATTGTTARAGSPPLELDFGLRNDAEARVLARAATLYNDHHAAAAAKVFAQYDSLEAQIGSAFAVGPAHGTDTLKLIVPAHPGSAPAARPLRVVGDWSGRADDEAASLRR